MTVLAITDSGLFAIDSRLQNYRNKKDHPEITSFGSSTYEMIYSAPPDSPLVADFRALRKNSRRYLTKRLRDSMR